MFPILFEAGGIKIYSYGFFIALGYVATLTMGRWLARARGLDPAPYMDVAFLAIVSGVIGARVLFVITAPATFLQHPAEIFNVWNGGLVFYGGFLLAAVVCLGYGVWKKMPILLSYDIAVTGVALAHGFGRIGCFAAGCCHGSACPYPWAIVNNTDFATPSLRGQPIHPVQLYESFLLFALTGLLAWLIQGKRARDGIPTAIYLIGYGVIRFVLEMFRGDDDRGAIGIFSTSQGISLVLFVVGCGILVGRFRRQDL